MVAPLSRVGVASQVLTFVGGLAGDTTVFLTPVWGGAQEPQSGFLDGVGGGGRLWLAFFKEVPLGGAAVTVLRQSGRLADRDPHRVGFEEHRDSTAAVLRRGGAVLPHCSPGFGPVLGQGC